MPESEVSKAKVEKKHDASKKAAPPPPADDDQTSCPLVTVIRAADVTAEYKEMAAGWPEWSSKTHPQKPAKSGKFHFDYNGDYATERVLITSGRATLKPDAGGAEVVIGAGDAVHFHRGFACMWHVTEPMKKNYAYFGDDGKEMSEEPEGITCDLCGAGCFAESYLHSDEDGTELDLCCGCFRKGKKKYAGAEHQKLGEPVLSITVVPAKKQRKE